MDIFLFMSDDELHDDPEARAEEMAQAMRQWLESADIKRDKFEVINREGGEHAVEERELGLLVSTGQKQDLRAPLAFLHELARQKECEFVVGKYDPDTGKPEKVAYFGHEEGRPDAFEIALYLGLKR